MLLLHVHNMLNLSAIRRKLLLLLLLLPRVTETCKRRTKTLWRSRQPQQRADHEMAANQVFGQGREVKEGKAGM